MTSTKQLRELVITADDFGLSERNTTTILEAVDAGAVTRVSVLANGFATERALAEWRARKETLSLALHFNLTEGKSVSAPDTVTHLAHPDGAFRRSPLRLLLATWFSLPSARRALRIEIARELDAQIARIRSGAGDVALAIDGHMHAHLVPMVFAAILDRHRVEPFASVRMSHEPLSLQRAAWKDIPYRYAAQSILIVLSYMNRRWLRKSGVTSPDFFVGTFASGAFTLDAARRGLAASVGRGARSVEVGTHPGSSTPDEVVGWRGNRLWHTSPWRAQERTMLVSPAFADLARSFREGELPGSNLAQVLRFLVAGVIATATNLGLLYLFTETFGIWYLGSAVLAYALATLVGFGLQKFWAFSYHATDRMPAEFGLFVLNNALGFLFDIAGLYVLVEYLGVWYMAAQFFLLALVATWNYFAFKYVIFRLRHAP